MEGYGNYVRAEYPKPIMELARSRVRGLLKYNICATAPLCLQLESAYLQGITDATETLLEVLGREKKSLVR